MFGVPFRADDQIIRPLEAQGLQRLYPHQFDHKKELKKLNYSILVNFLDLLDILIKVRDGSLRNRFLGICRSGLMWLPPSNMEWQDYPFKFEIN